MMDRVAVELDERVDFEVYDESKTETAESSVEADSLGGILCPRKLVEIEIERIFSQSVPESLRKSVDQLRENIRSVRRLYVPILVREATEEERRLYNKDYFVMDGRRRLQAMKELGYTHIPALVMSYDDDAKAAIITNECRKPNYWVRAFYVDSMRRRGMSVEEISKSVKLSTRSVRRCIAVMRLYVGIQMLVRQDLLKFGLAAKLGELNVSHDEQLLLYKRIEGALSSAGKVSGREKKRIVNEIVEEFIKHKRGHCSTSSNKNCSEVARELRNSLGVVEDFLCDIECPPEVFSALHKMKRVIENLEKVTS